ncbi:hypothetical protein WN59_09740 [Salinicoccus sediminis]|uniref:DUF2382 domain-containing protein n=1 Tax=Salinicoccus sediminis TaxID=1432562 RepID=A0A0M2SMR5_9STAP|nr:YsnF/AvaK domain-containing protein [Salinicoccus sediminis]KKK33885.1 hypothetical protein WN59_09740 [Salinicoccus sediminis]
MGTIESFSNEQQLLNRIDHYKRKNLREERLTVISEYNLGDMLIHYPNVRQKSSEGDAWHRIVAWFSGDDRDEQIMDELHLGDYEQQVYKKSLENGKMLLYIDYDDETLRSIKGQEPYAANTNDNGDEGHIADDTMPLREERLVVDKENVNLGEVIVSKYTDSEFEEMDIPVEYDDVDIERRRLEAEPLLEDYNNDDTDDDENVIRIPITRDRLKVIKERVVTEEVVIRKDRRTETKHISEVVSHEDIKVTEVKQETVDEERYYRE